MNSNSNSNNSNSTGDILKDYTCITGNNSKNKMNE